MQMIIAIIKPHRLQDVQDALEGLGVAGMTVSEVQGYGRQHGQKEIYRGAEYQVSFVPKVKLEIAADNDQAEKIIEAITSAAKTDSIGDGKIFSFDLDNAVRIRTGETGTEAL